MAADGAGGLPGRPGLVEPGVSVFSDEVGAEICAAVAAGRPLMKVCREPGRPHRTTVRNWERAHPEFGEALRAAYRQARISQRMRDRQAAAEAALRPPPRRGGKASSYTPALGAAICARLEEGESLTSIGRDKAMPCYGTILAWAKRHPEFGEMYVAAREVQAERLWDEAQDVADRATMETVPLARLAFDVIRWRAARVAAKKYLDRLEAHQAAIQAEAAARTRAMEAKAAGGKRKHVVFHMTHFEVMDGRVLAAPPRNREEAQAWVEATGKPYEQGVGPKGQVRPPPFAFEDAAEDGGEA